MRFKLLYYLFLFIALLTNIGQGIACPACEENQPTITSAITHGTGPSSSWDWIWVYGMLAITLFFLVMTVRALLKVKEGKEHIKNSILDTHEF